MIRIDSLRMTYRSTQSVFQAVRGVSLVVEQGQFYTLLGPSGCGKTTTLRCIAGLERPDSGEIIIGDQRVVSSEKQIFVPPHDRRIGMVFQSYAIWPHMSVFENVVFPLRYLRPRPGARDERERVHRALALVKLDALADRPGPLSQRRPAAAPGARARAGRRTAGAAA